MSLILRRAMHVGTAMIKIVKMREVVVVMMTIVGRFECEEIVFVPLLNCEEKKIG
jgi:hypothetical protein